MISITPTDIEIAEKARTIILSDMLQFDFIHALAKKEGPMHQTIEDLQNILWYRYFPIFAAGAYGKSGGITERNLLYLKNNRRDGRLFGRQ